MTNRNLLFVFAHPDDESFSSGVTIAKYAQQTGSEVYLLCATRGQAGKPGNPPVCTMEELPQVREQELRLAAGILGIKELQILDHQDKCLGEVPLEQLQGEIAGAIDRWQPSVVVTFAPHGISGHPDHQAISRVTDLTVKSLPLEKNPVQKLYHVTLPLELLAANQYGDPLDKISTTISAPEYKAVVGQALRAHKTQHLSVQRAFPGVMEGNDDQVREQNYFILAWAKRAEMLSEKTTDLFAGVL
ncbi:PIG-L deacetylase family protein [Brevibacillus fulvus]|uniref:LmbE family N-acetylglucosaminyl deacetylase n=1 Tax=Brevibacillus fulvus TaxID=1125967 RepID=A0A939BQR6_9BACL|nr:PIG-L deacetylase family protein [Brevibacillus fulvus]MBM7588678.1 LmbE family N-acetylglucosaminyl deacetylase [Brevibacillus fulvus]